MWLFRASAARSTSWATTRSLAKAISPPRPVTSSASAAPSIDLIESCRGVSPHQNNIDSHLLHRSRASPFGHSVPALPALIRINKELER